MATNKGKGADSSGMLTDLKRFGNLSRRGFLKTSALAGGALAAGAVPGIAASAERVDGIVEELVPEVPWMPKVPDTGKKVKIGVPLGYGPYNQPWRRGCWRLIKRIEELGAEAVTIRGKPSKDSEKQMELNLLDRGIDALVMGIYMSEQESTYIAKEAHKRGIATVGFAINVFDSPAAVEDTWGTSMRLTYAMLDDLQRAGVVGQIAENPGFYRPFDMEVALSELMIKWEPNMKGLPRVLGGVSTDDEIAVSRKNITALLQSHPEKDSIQAIMSWWWPCAIGTAQAMQRADRDEIKLFSHYFSDQLLGDWADGKFSIAGATDTPWTIMGEKAADMAVAQARGIDVPKKTYHVPVRFISTKDEAALWLKQLKEWDKEAVEFLKPYGG